MTERRRNAVLVAALRRRGLGAPLAMLTEISEPLMPLLSDLATVASPLLDPLFRRHEMRGATSEARLSALLGEMVSGDDERGSG